MTAVSEYADELEGATEDAVSFARSCSAEEWVTVVPGEDWPVSVLVHHVALGYDHVSSRIDCALEGQPVEKTGEEVDAENLRHAQEFARVGLAETVELLRAKAGAMALKMRRLGDADLERTAPFAPAGGAAFNVDQFCQAAVGHIRSHIGHARAALGRTGTES